MKKTILAVVTTSLLAASANAANVYDKDGQTLDFTGRLQYEAGQAADQNFGGDALARFGFEGKWATGTDVSLIGKGEWEVSSEDNTDDTVAAKETTDSSADANNIQARYAYIGADFGNGIQATVGTQDSAFKELASVSDIFNEYSGSAEYQLDGNSRWDDSAKVAYAADGWDLRSSVSFADTEKEVSNANVQNHYAAAAGYTFAIDDVQSIKAVVGYQAIKGDDTASNGYTNSQYGIGLGYTYDALYVGSTLTQAKYEANKATYAPVDYKDNTWALSAAYKFQPDWTAYAGYAIVEGHNNNLGASTEYYELGLQYDITAKAMAYTEYKFDQVSGKDDSYYVGLQYNF